MDLRQLRYFITVVNLKHFSKAAEALHISQPSLSNAIKKLEKEVGFQLLERNTRSFSITESGQAFYTKAQELMKKYDNMAKELHEIKQVGRGTISIGFIESSKFWLLGRIKTFKEKYPDICLDLKETLGHENVIQAIENYDVHLTITNQPIESDEISVSELYVEEFVLVVHKDHRLAKQPKVSLSDMINEEFIISTKGFQTRENILEAFAKEELKPSIMFEYERFETACSLIEQDLGISILPESYTRYNANPNLITRRIRSKHLQRPVYVAFSNVRMLPPAVVELIEEIRTVSEIGE
ncbi:LysR family transcriptional regulator [Halalkalibacter krulwichiae]|uniref:HTH-type transcriptional regulator GltC n=1 Tax=Halalkalibacter krulwichiae TaxID=199441 RepID=A0A1X9MG02_9BACI|nr:LysR family transcriptional regulator [Halalkalibacter krulwichiae]ARK32346.1 HTH-type transcriptional regulator GltC [Halalkalibacter krulwichiae]